MKTGMPACAQKYMGAAYFSQNRKGNKHRNNKNKSPAVEEKDRNAVSLDLMNRMKLHGMANLQAEPQLSNGQKHDNRRFPVYAACPGMGLQVQCSNRTSHPFGLLPV